jgi:DNA/RNA endonuclease YhcR with UshA esterase domain
MQKEEKIVIVLLIMAISSIAVAYITFFPSDPMSDRQYMGPGSDIGDQVVLEGEVLGKRFTYTGDHLLMDIDNGQMVVKVFVPNSAGAVDIGNDIFQGDIVRVLGTVDEYKGEVEVVVGKKSDVTII